MRFQRQHFEWWDQQADWAVSFLRRAKGADARAYALQELKSMVIDDWLRESPPWLQEGLAFVFLSEVEKRFMRKDKGK